MNGGFRGQVCRFSGVRGCFETMYGIKEMMHLRRPRVHFLLASSTTASTSWSIGGMCGGGEALEQPRFSG